MTAEAEDGLDRDLKDLLGELDQIENDQSRIGAAEDSRSLHAVEAGTRNLAAMLFVWTYVGGIAIIMLTLAGRYLFFGDDKPAAMMVELFKTAVVPVITFIIGYYYQKR